MPEIGDGLVPSSEEEVRFLPSGKIVVSINGQTFQMRRPKLGEFRTFRETLYEEQDQAHEELLKRADTLIEQAQAEADAQRSPEDQRRELIDIVTQARKMRSDAERQEDHYVTWSRTAVETLSGRKIEVEDDDLPFVFGTSDFVTAVQRHWRTVPLPSGAR